MKSEPITFFHLRAAQQRLGPEHTQLRREGRKVSRRQWRRQNAKALRRRRTIRLWLENANRMISREIDRAILEKIMAPQVIFMDQSGRITPQPITPPSPELIYAMDVLDQARREIARITGLSS